MRNPVLILMSVIMAAMLASCGGSNKPAVVDSTALKNNGSLNEDDARFALTAADDGNAEVELSFFAKDKLTDAKLKAYAATVVDDYARLNADLVKTTKPKNTVLPVSLGSQGQQDEDDLGQHKGADFDKAYTDLMIKYHGDAVKLYQDATDNVKDADLKSYAMRSLPVIKKQADAINALKK